MSTSNTTPMGCAKIAIMLKGDPRKLQLVNTRIELYMLKVSARIAT